MLSGCSSTSFKEFEDRASDYAKAAREAALQTLPAWMFLSEGRLTLGLGIGTRKEDYHVDAQTGPLGPAPVQPGGPEVLISAFERHPLGILANILSSDERHQLGILANILSSEDVAGSGRCYTLSNEGRNSYVPSIKTC